MITPTNYSASLIDINAAANDLLTSTAGKHTINQQTGRFFYDPWIIKPEYKGTVWEHLLSSISVDHGEARIITLTSKSNYVSHCDIDDRLHLNLSGTFCYLIDLSSNIMYLCETDGVWYHMNTSKLHSAANFGNRYRHQLVVRTLLHENTIKDPVNVALTSNICDLEEVRFIFDHKISPLLNLANKSGHITNFKLVNNFPQFTCEQSFVSVLKDQLGSELELHIV